MKKAAKVFLIIAIVLGGLNLFINFVSLLGIGTWAGTEGSSELTIVTMIGDSISLIYAAATIIISSLSLVNLNKATSKKELLVWGILCLFLEDLYQEFYCFASKIKISSQRVQIVQV